MFCPLVCRVIGFRPGDPTAGPLPATMPAPLVPPPAGMQRVDLRRMSMEELHAAAAATQPRDVFAALLPDPPGGQGAGLARRNLFSCVRVAHCA